MKTTTEQHISLIEKIKEVKREHRDIILILIVGDRYDDIYKIIGESDGSKAVAIYFTKLVDRLLDNGEYDKAVIYACDIIFRENSQLTLSDIGGYIWEYFHKVHDECLDWYYGYKANSEIDKFLENEKNNK